MKFSVCSKNAKYPLKQQLYKIYYNACRFSPDWKQVEFDGFKLIGQGNSKQYVEEIPMVASAGLVNEVQKDVQCNSQW